jgi:hypothetical protein
LDGEDFAVSNTTVAGLADERCKWHEHQTEGRKVGPDDDPYEGCSHCGRLIETKDCNGCGLTFLDWNAEGFDDTLSGPAVTPGGEVVCVPCSRRAQAEEERAAPETRAESIVDWKASYEEALRQRDALQTDANRYRWLRDFTYVEAYYIDGAGGVDTKVRTEGSGHHLDLAVDLERIKDAPRDAVVAGPSCADQIAWLIEMVGERAQPLYWHAEPDMRCIGGFDPDPNKAMRFCREQDARAMALMLGSQGMIAMTDVRRVKITEHEWPAGESNAVVVGPTCGKDTPDGPCRSDRGHEGDCDGLPY